MDLIKALRDKQLSPLTLTNIVDCTKFAFYAQVGEKNYVNKSGEVFDTVVFWDIEGNPFEQCAIAVEAGSLNGAYGNYTRTSGGGSKTTGSATFAEAEPTTVDGFQFGSVDNKGVFTGNYEVSGLKGISASAFISFLTDTTPGVMYDGLVGLLSQRSVVRGSSLGDRIEVGAGNDKVIAKQGNDFVTKWKKGNLEYDGGDGVDTLSFLPDLESQKGPAKVVQKLVVDLAKGNGQTPYGGTLDLTSVERIEDTSRRDKILGSKADETVVSEGAKGDVFNLRGGDDRFEILSTMTNSTVSGGVGTDTLFLWNLGHGTHRLNLNKQEKNAGAMEGAKVNGVEKFEFATQNSTTHVHVIGTDAHETTSLQNFFSRDATARFEMRGGNDRVTGGYGNDVLNGGRGRDALTGLDGNDRLIGGLGADDLTGGAGNDRMTGGSRADTFLFALGFGKDVITDFTPGQDVLDFSFHAEVTRRKDLKVLDRDAGARVLDGEGGRVDLLGVDAADLTREDFFFG